MGARACRCLGDEGRRRDVQASSAPSQPKLEAPNTQPQLEPEQAQQPSLADSEKFETAPAAVLAAATPARSIATAAAAPTEPAGDLVAENVALQKAEAFKVIQAPLSENVAAAGEGTTEVKASAGTAVAKRDVLEATAEKRVTEESVAAARNADEKIAAQKVAAEAQANQEQAVFEGVAVEKGTAEKVKAKSKAKPKTKATVQAPAPEKRIDPEDGCAYTLDELIAFYKGKFKKAAVIAYFRNTCKPVGKGHAKT